MNSSPVVNWQTSVPTPIHYPMNMMQSPYIQESPNAVKRSRRVWRNVVGVIVGVLILLCIIVYFVYKSESQFVRATEDLTRKINLYITTPPTEEQCAAFKNQLREWNRIYGGKRIPGGNKYVNMVLEAEQNYFSAYKAKFDELLSLYSKMEDYLQRHIYKWSRNEQTSLAVYLDQADYLEKSLILHPPSVFVAENRLARKLSYSNGAEVVVKKFQSELTGSNRENFIGLKQKWETALFGKHLSYPVSGSVWKLILEVDSYWFKGRHCLF